MSEVKYPCDANALRGQQTRRWAAGVIAEYQSRKKGLVLPSNLRYNALETNEQYIGTQSGVRNDGNQSRQMSEMSQNGPDNSGRVRLLWVSISGVRADKASQDVGRSARAQRSEHRDKALDSQTAGLPLFLLRAIAWLSSITRSKDTDASNALGSSATLRLRTRQSQPEFRGSLSRLQSNQAEYGIPNNRGSEDLYQCAKKSERLFPVKNASDAVLSSNLNDLGNASVRIPAAGINGSNAPMSSGPANIIAGRDAVTPPLLDDRERGRGDSTNARLHRLIGKYRDFALVLGSDRE